MNLNMRGVIVPMVTPFTEAGELDTAAVKPLADFLLARGVAGLFPAGTTGEGPLLKFEERCRLAEAVVAAADGRVPVIMHTGAITTRETIKLTEYAQAAGVSGAAIVPPYFYRLSDDALFRHFESVARRVPDFPLYLYDNPAVTPNGISTGLAARLVGACPNIVGMKDSSGSLDKLAAGLRWRDGAFNTASGPDGLILPALALGVDACVSGNANIVPELVVALYEAVAAGNLAAARPLQAKLNQVTAIVRDGADLSLFKAVLAQRGLPVGTVRPPLRQASVADRTACWQQLCALGLDLTSV